jgi:hypothetical protein
MSDFDDRHSDTKPSPTPTVVRQLESSLPESPEDQPIILQVGERRITTFRSTLTGQSEFFRSRLSGCWANVKLLCGAYFIDADAGLFESILSYLRRGVFPLFYDLENGHCHHRYVRLLEEARYFQVPGLVEWLEKRVYLQALRVEYVVREADSLESLEHTARGAEQWTFCSTWETRQIYLCPRGIYVHRGSPGLCGRQCLKARGEGSIAYDEERFLRTVMVGKLALVDAKLCKEGWDLA